MFPLKNTEAYIHANGYRSTLGKELAARDADISEVKSEIQALANQLEDEAETRAALGAHNLLENMCTSLTANGITVIVNADKSMTISTGDSGATANTDIIINSIQYFKKGQYILSGCPSGGTESTYKLRVSRGFDESVDDTGNGASLSLANDGASAIYCKIDVKSGTIITTPITFKPMIRLATDSDPTYQPYAKTNVELTQKSDTYTEITLTVNDATITSNNSKMIKQNGVVDCSLIFSPTENKAGYATIFKDIPTEFIPKMSKVGGLFMWLLGIEADTQKLVVLYVTTSGTILTTNPLVAGYTYRCAGSWISNE